MVWQFVVSLSVLGGYFILMGRSAHQLSALLQRRHLLWFTLGLLAVLFAFVPSPQLFGADYRFTANMIEFFILTGLAAPLFLLGIPRIILDRLPTHRSKGISKSPVFAFIVSNLILLGWHLPMLFEAASRDPALWSFKQLTLLGAGLIAWLPVFEGELVWGKNFNLLRLLYLFFLSIPTTILGALFTLASSLVYSARALAFEICAPAFISDQQAGGLVMWYGGAMIDLVALSILFFRWFGASDSPAEN